MKRITHTLLGAAAAAPFALTLPPLGAAGCLWFGMVGGGWPDWFDLRSEARSTLRLRHRGVSHSLLLAFTWSALLWLTIGAVVESGVLGLSPAVSIAWTGGFFVGICSHLLGDACTHAGIQPWLPVSRRHFWLLPKPLRTRSDGAWDRVGRFLALTAVTAGMVIYVIGRF
ncbi:MAG: metal-dependent hydrolase [Chloroflexota bacterium]|nr:metal-dependent hydrolase [Chloroflexota bacterium]